MIQMTILKYQAAALAMSCAALLSACGGGGGDAGTPPWGGGGGDGVIDSGTTGAVSNSGGSVLMSLSTAQISSSSPGTVTAVVKNAAGAVVPGALVTFSLSGTSSSIASLNPVTAITNSNGEASSTLTPTSSSVSGAAYVNASADTSAGTLTAKATFSVSAINVTLTAVSAASPTLAAYQSTAINFTVSGASSASPVAIAVSSTCSASNKAVISPSSLTLTSTTGTVSYQDQGCSATDRINVQIVGTSQNRSVDVAVAAPLTRAIQFASATPESICLAGSGCPVSSIVSFKVVDENGVGKPNIVVDFSLDQPNIATLNQTQGTTDASGIAQVSVSAKSTPSPVRVRAALATDSTLSTVSNALTINAGLPTNDAVSFSAEKYAMNGNLDGDDSDLRIQLSDRFGNPVPDGTRVNLVAEGASVIPASCTTVDSVCTPVKFVVSNPRPANGRVEVVAYAVGEESYTDANANLAYDLGESFSDLGEVYLDKNENGVLDTASGEYITGTAANGVWDSNTYVRASNRFYLSNTVSAPRFYVANSVPGGGYACSTTQIASLPAATLSLAGTTCRASYAFCVRDANTNADALGGNPIASGSIVEVATNASGGAVSVSNTPIPSTAAVPTLHVVTAQRSACDTPLTAGGSVDISFTMGGTKFTTNDFLRITN
ncbi:MAG: hypothetical protein ACOZE7_09965 [Pseudomonadota bacterium]